MYFSRILPPARLDRLKDGYQLHQTVWNFFSDGPDRRRDFLYRVDLVHGIPRIYALSERPPLDYGSWQVDHKPFHPNLDTGSRLMFSLRVNPVVSKKGRKRHDVVMDRKHALKATNGDDWNSGTTMDALVREAGLEWLRRRAPKHGFEFQDGQVRVDGYRQHRLYKQKNRPQFSTLDYNGLITITDPEAFMAILKRGIGPAKSFGCGLFLLRPVT